MGVQVSFPTPLFVIWGNFMICTSSYDSFDGSNYSVYSISGNLGVDASYNGKCYSALAPKIGFWHEWESNKDNRSFEENTRFYIGEYWKQVLFKLDPLAVFNYLDNSILLCYEPNTEFCHRHIVAAWFEILLGEYVPEVKYNNGIEIVSRPDYVKDYLEDAMRLDKDMRGFNSLRALYLFEKAELYEKHGCHGAAVFLKCDADMAESDYNALNKKKKLIKK